MHEEPYRATWHAMKPTGSLNPAGAPLTDTVVVSFPSGGTRYGVVRTIRWVPPATVVTGLPAFGLVTQPNSVQ